MKAIEMFINSPMGKMALKQIPGQIEPILKNLDNHIIGILNKEKTDNLLENEQVHLMLTVQKNKDLVIVPVITTDLENETHFRFASKQTQSRLIKAQLFRKYIFSQIKKVIKK